MLETVKDDEWGLYPNFSKKEMECKHTGECYITHKLMKLLQDIRNEYQKPIIITSGYRDLSHPREKDKSRPGEHTMGMAADIAIYGPDAIRLVAIAYRLGINRVGLKQKGPMSTRFVHFGVGDQAGKFPAATWSY